MKAAIVFAIVLLVPGCSSLSSALNVQDVDIPVAVMAAPPPELTAPLPAPGFTFISPGDKEAVAAIDKAGASALVGWVGALQSRIEAWEAWAVKP